MRVLLASAGGMLLIKLFLVVAQPMKAVTGAAFDDALFLALARQIGSGNWLGNYTSLTLAKGPGAPIFIATMHGIGLPLPIALHLLYAAACLITVIAIRPVVRGDRWLIAAYALLLFDPMTFDAGAMTRLNRSHLYASVILICLASLVGLAAWRPRIRASRLPWIAAAGMSGGYAWITREETVMVIPALLTLVAGLTAWTALSGTPREARSFIVSSAAALMISLALVGLIATINYANYGAFRITELSGGAFARAYQALCRIPPVNDKGQIAMTLEARRKAYGVSPAFRELEPWLEGPRADFWVEQSVYFFGGDPRERGIHRAFFVWALREAAASAGKYDSPVDADAFFEQVAGEIHDACGGPVLDCGPAGSGVRPPLSSDGLRSIARSWLRAMTYVVTFGKFTAYTAASIGTEDGIRTFSEWANWPVAPLVDVPQPGLRLRTLQTVGIAYRFATPILLLAALTGFGLGFARALRQRRLELLHVFAAGAIVLFASCTGVVALVDALAFPAITSLYLAPAYPALLLFISLVGLHGNRRATEEVSSAG